MILAAALKFDQYGFRFFLPEYWGCRDAHLLFKHVPTENGPPGNCDHAHVQGSTRRSMAAGAKTMES